MEPVLEIAQSAGGTGPDAGLRAVGSLRALTERLEIVQVENARSSDGPGRTSPGGSA